MKKNRLRAIYVCACTLFLLGGPAFGHHSFSMFDPQKQVTLIGTVKSFQFANPHCFIQLLVPGESEPVEWSIEMGATVHLLRSGWKPNTLTPGEKLTVVINPLKAGGPGGNFVSAVDGSGKAVGGQR